MSISSLRLVKMKISSIFMVIIVFELYKKKNSFILKVQSRFNFLSENILSVENLIKSINRHKKKTII